MPIYTFSEYKSLNKKDQLRRANFATPAKLDGRPIIVDFVDIWDQAYTDEYTIGAYGALTTGEKIKVVIKNINVTFDILIPDQDMTHFMTKITGFIGVIKKAELIKQKEGHYFKPTLNQYVRLYYKTVKARNQARDAAIKSGYKVAFDDGGYFRAPHNKMPLKVSRESQVGLAGMNEISKYTIIQRPDEEVKSYKNEKTSYVYIIEADIADIKTVDLKVAPKAKTLVAYCDIETNSETLSFPSPLNEKDEIFILTSTFCWTSANDHLANLIIYQTRGNNEIASKALLSFTQNPKNIIIAADNERQLLMAFIEVYSHMLPDYWIDFNGIEFDQPYLFNRLSRFYDDDLFWNGRFLTNNHLEATKDENQSPIRYSLLDKFKNGIEFQFTNYKSKFEDRYSYSRKFIKVNASKIINGNSLLITGMFYIDARVTLMRIYSGQSETGLKHFLAIMKLPPKHDMPPLAMWSLFKNPTCNVNIDKKEYDFAGLINYATYDAQSIHAMFIKQNIYTQAVSDAQLTFTTLHDSYYNAGGLKVHNYIMWKAWHGIVDFDGNITPVALSLGDDPNIDEEDKKKKYDGAYVVPPKFFSDGRIPYPVAPLDASSLYPSMSMTYNISPDTLIKDKSLMAQYAATHKLEHSKVNFGDKELECAFVRYDTDNMAIGTERGMGVLPSCWAILIKRREVLKKDLNNAKLAKEEAEVNKQHEKEDELDFTIIKLDIVQKSVKILMNTIYGVSGNKRSPFFDVMVAGSITAKGQTILKFAIEKAHSERRTLVYGDTDSMYTFADPATYAALEQWYKAADDALCNNRELPLAPLYDPEINKWAKGIVKKDPEPLIAIGCTRAEDLPPEIYTALSLQDRRRHLKTDFYARMVILAQYQAAQLEKFVNDEFVKFTGTRRTKFAYEEVLFPASFTGKKKYYGVQNVNPSRKIIKFDWTHKNHKFIRGLDFIKRGTPPIMETIGIETICECLDIMETRTIREIVEEKIKEFPSRKWNIKDFTQKAEYKPDKKNVKVISFKQRMDREFAIQEAKVRHGDQVPQIYKSISPGIQFSYVICTNTNYATLLGYRRAVKVGDKMEFPEVVEHYNLKIDINHYMYNSLAGLLARFISYDNQFRSADSVKKVIPDSLNPEDIEQEYTDFDEDGDQISDDDIEDDDEYAKKDAAAVKLAKMHINKLMEHAFNIQRTDLKEAKATGKQILNKISHKFESFGAIEDYVIKHDQTNTAPVLVDIVKHAADIDCKKKQVDCNAIMASYKTRGISNKQLLHIYNHRPVNINGVRFENITTIKQRIYKEKELIIINELQKLNSQCAAISGEIMDAIKNNNLDNINIDQRILETVQDLTDELSSVRAAVHTLSNIHNLVLNSNGGIIIAPPMSDLIHTDSVYKPF